MDNEKNSKVAADMAAFMITVTVLFITIGILLHWITLPGGDWTEHVEHDGVIGD